MEKHEVPWELICSKWFICLFCDILPIETVFRIWDCLLYNGSRIVMKVAVLIIILHQDDILATKEFTEIVTGFKKFLASKQTLYCHDFIQVSRLTIILSGNFAKSFHIFRNCFLRKSKRALATKS